MSYFLKTLMFVALCVIAVTVAQESEDAEDYNENVLQRKMWVACDSFTTPKYSCFNCNTQLVCKDYKGKGGELKPCSHPLMRYCNGGFCSPTPSEECQEPVAVPQPVPEPVPVQDPEPVQAPEPIQTNGLRQKEEASQEEEATQEEELSEEAEPGQDETVY